MYQSKSYGDVEILTLEYFWSYVQGDKILG